MKIKDLVKVLQSIENQDGDIYFALEDNEGNLYDLDYQCTTSQTTGESSDINLKIGKQL